MYVQYALFRFLFILSLVRDELVHVHSLDAQVLDLHEVSRWVHLFLVVEAQAGRGDEEGVKVLAAELTAGDLGDVHLYLEVNLVGSVFDERNFDKIF